jgi:hypothetical protein
MASKRTTLMQLSIFDSIRKKEVYFAKYTQSKILSIREVLGDELFDKLNNNK